MKNSLILSLLFLIKFMYCQDLSDLSYMSPDKILSIRNFNKTLRLKNNIEDNQVVFFIYAEKNNFIITDFKVTFKFPSSFKVYNKKDLNKNPSIAGYNPDGWAQWNSDSTQITFFIKEAIDEKHPRKIWFHIVPILNDTNFITAEFTWKINNKQQKPITINSGKIISTAPKNINWIICKTDSTNKLLGQFIYNYDYTAYMSDNAIPDFEMSNGIKTLHINSLILPKSFDFSKPWDIKQGSKIKWGSTTWEVAQKNILPKDCSSKQKLPYNIQNSIPLCINAVLNNKGVEIKWQAIKNSTNLQYSIYQTAIHINNNAYECYDTTSVKLGTTNSNYFFDTTFYNLPKDVYCVYYNIQTVGTTPSYNQSLPIIKSSGIGFKPVFIVKYLEAEIGSKWLNSKQNPMISYIQMRFFKIKFNKYFSILPINFRLQSQFKNDFSADAFATFELRDKLITLRFGGGIQLLTGKHHKPFYGPEIISTIKIQNYSFKNKILKQTGFIISARYTPNGYKFNYSGLFMGLSYNLVMHE